MKDIDIKAFRRANNLTQSKLGAYLGMDKCFISAIEHGRSKLPKVKLGMILHNPHNWDTSMLVSVETKTTENGKVPVFKVVDTVQQNSEALKNKAQELLIQDYQRQIADKDATIQELCKQIGMLEAKIELLEKGDITPESV